MQHIPSRLGWLKNKVTENRLFWLATRVPSALISTLLTVSLLSLAGLYIAGGVGFVNLDTLHLPGFLNRIWGLFLENPGTWSAIISGSFSMFFSRAIVVSVKPLAEDSERMWWLNDKLNPVLSKLDPVTSVIGWVFAKLNPVAWVRGRDKVQAASAVAQKPSRPRFAVRVVYAALTLPYMGLALTMFSLWAGFTLAGFLLATFYTLPATKTVKTGVYAWLQQPPGAVLYALTRIFTFGIARGDEKVKAKAGLRDVLDKNPQLFGSFGPELRLSKRFYLRGVPVILALAMSLFAGYGVLLFTGYASGASPQAWQISSVVVGSIVAGILVGWGSCWLSSLIVWANTFGRPRTKEDWWGVNKAAFAAMCGSVLGPLSQGVGFLMAALLIHGQSEAINLGLYVFWGHVAGDMLSQIVVLATAKQMSGSSKQANAQLDAGE